MREDREQEAVIQWCDLKRIPVYHVPNGGRRDPREAAHLKRLGVRAGVPDLCVPVARGGYHGLYVEMKAGRNKTTEKQDEWLRLLKANGYATAVCWGAGQAIDTITDYMRGSHGA